ncbi:hypothetical protein FO519_004258 [Halicephalobus sp. NKZ332]|nr:hypothetical protein FO519_004258 [Halicephalobus sp. NKZ332]
MCKYFVALKPDWDEFVQEIQSLMDNPAEFFVNKPEEAKTFCVLVAVIQIITLLLAHSYFGNFIAIFIGFSSLIGSATTALFSQSVKDEFARLPAIQFFSNGQAKWKHVQFTISWSLTAANFISIILQIALSTKYTVYLFTTILSILLCAAYLIEALATLRIDSGSNDERAHVADERVV